MVKPLTPNPEYLGSAPDIPRQATPDFRKAEFGFQASDPDEDDFKGSDRVRFGSGERALAVGDQKEVGPRRVIFQYWSKSVLDGLDHLCVLSQD